IYVLAGRNVIWAYPHVVPKYHKYMIQWLILSHKTRKGEYLFPLTGEPGIIDKIYRNFLLC
ncbi:MAG: hypothetical protein D6755_07430, partial [Anaerolineae bacterium]